MLARASFARARNTYIYKAIDFFLNQLQIGKLKHGLQIRAIMEMYFYEVRA
jgi:hypothetical protein